MPLQNRMSTGTNSVRPKLEKLQPPNRRLVLMFDGTGNTRVNLSNVARMFEAIDDSLPEGYATYPTLGPDGPCFTCGQGKRLQPDQEPVQLVKYIKGVGTNFFGHLSGLGFGFGLSANVKEGYVWLSNNYREGDEIFVFGFSRGAFSARSLVSLVHRCGGVLKNVSVSSQNKPELKVSDQVVVNAYTMYQAYVQTTDRKGVDKEDSVLYRDFYDKFQAFKATSCEIHEVKVKMLGVWDTVGAVGIPETGCKLIDDYVYPMSRYNNKQYQFHGQALSCIVQNAYHALALDEHRQHFKPTLWDNQTNKEQEVKQVWFAGSHCNVGGGADMEDFLDPDDLWQYSYVWMQRHAQKHGLRFYWTYDSPATQKMDHAHGKPMPTRRVSLRTPEDSFSLFLNGKYQWFFPPFHRDVVPTNGAKLHWSVKDRIEQAQLHWSSEQSSIKQDDEKRSYYQSIKSRFGKGDRTEKHEKRGYYPTTLFGEYGEGFASVGADKFEIHRLDVDNPELVSKTVWQIETDPEVNEVMMEPSSPSLGVTDCGCSSGDPEAPTKQKGLWSLLGY